MQQIKEIHEFFLKSKGVCTDTRKLKPNQIFIALKGENFNGNHYVDLALQNGALLAIVDEKQENYNNKIVVKDALKTLQKLASYHRDYLQIPIIAITGSNGKTTTKRLIHSVLQEMFNVKSTIGNLNNHIGVPLSILEFDENTEIGIIEMGANHQKEIALLSEITKPDFGYITNFGKAHLEGFGGIEGVVKGKSELYDYLRVNNKLVFVNADDTKQLERLHHTKTYSFGENNNAHLPIHFIQANPFVKLKFQNIEIESKLIGAYNFKNIAAAVGIGYYFDVPITKIKSAIQNFEAKDNRSQIKRTTYNTLILDAYNANPTSMQAALESFHQYDAKDKVVILGDMFELGKSKHKEHQYIANLAKKLEFDQLFFCGSIFYSSLDKKSNTTFKSFQDLKNHLIENPIKNSHILIKGSRGMALERLNEFL